MESLESLKLHSIDIAGHYALSDREDFQKYAERILNCANRVQLKVDFSTQKLDSWLAHIEQCWWCRVPLCPLCLRAKVAKWRVKFFKGLTRLNLENPGLNWALLTFTIRNCHVDNLRQTISQMADAWHRLKVSRLGITGYSRAFEITRNFKTGEAHPHYHVLACSYFSFNRSMFDWSRLWGQALQVSYQPICDGRRFYDFQGSLCELVKYTNKPSDLSADASWLYSISDQLYRSRSITTGGLIARYVSQRVLNQIDKEMRSGDECSQQGRMAYADWDYQNEVYDIDFVK